MVYWLLYKNTMTNFSNVLLEFSDFNAKEQTMKNLTAFFLENALQAKQLNDTDYSLSTWFQIALSKSCH